MLRCNGPQANIKVKHWVTLSLTLTFLRESIFLPGLLDSVLCDRCKQIFSEVQKKFWKKTIEASFKNISYFEYQKEGVQFTTSAGGGSLPQ